MSAQYIISSWPSSIFMPKIIKVGGNLIMLCQEQFRLFFETRCIFTVHMHGLYAVTKCYLACADHTCLLTAYKLFCYLCCYYLVMSIKLTLEIFEPVLVTAVSTTRPKDAAQLIFSFRSRQPLGLYYEKPATQRIIQGVLRWRNTTQDVIQSTSKVQTVCRHGN